MLPIRCLRDGITVRKSNPRITITYLWAQRSSKLAFYHGQFRNCGLQPFPIDRYYHNDGADHPDLNGIFSYDGRVRQTDLNSDTQARPSFSVYSVQSLEDEENNVPLTRDNSEVVVFKTRNGCGRMLRGSALTDIESLELALSTFFGEI